MVSRLEVLMLGAGSTLGPIAGCAHPKTRTLDFESIELTQTGLSKFNLKVEPAVSGLSSDEFLTFHDVTLFVFDSKGNELAQEQLGTISMEASTNTISFSVTGIPAVITYKASETPCDKRTSIAAATWDRGRDGEFIYDITGYRKCKSVFPPKFTINRNYGTPYHPVELENKTNKPQNFSIRIWQAEFPDHPVADFTISVQSGSRKQPLIMRSRSLYQLVVKSMDMSHA